MDALLDAATGKSYRRLMPPLVALCALTLLDRSNVGFAKGVLRADVGIGNAAFAFGAGIFFFGYAVFEVPSNLLLRRVGARRWLCRIAVTWGLVAAAMALVRGPWSFYALRFALGVAEAGCFPGMILFVTDWFPERRRGEAMSAFYLGLPLSLLVGGPLSGWLLDLGGVGGLLGWQWMFVVEGGLACLAGLWVLWFLEDGPGRAAWLAAEERTAIRDALAREERDKAALRADGGPRLGATVPTVCYLTATYFLVQVSAYGLIFYLPSIVSADMGRRVGLAVGLVTAVPWLVSLVAMLFVARWSDRSGGRAGLVCGLYGLLAVSLLVSAYVGLVPGVAALCLAAAGYCVGTPLFWTICTERLRGGAATVGIAVIGSLGNLGGFVAPVLKTAIENWTGSGAAGMVFIAATALGGAAMVGGLGRRAGRPAALAVPS